MTVSRFEVEGLEGVKVKSHATEPSKLRTGYGVGRGKVEIGRVEKEWFEKKAEQVGEKRLENKIMFKRYKKKKLYWKHFCDIILNIYSINAYQKIDKCEEIK